MKEAQVTTKTRAMQTVEDCLEAYRQCVAGLSHCLDCNDARSSGPHIRLLLDAADINLAASNFLTRASRYHRPLLELAAEVNEAAADSLSALGKDNPLLKAAYTATLRAAAGCKEILDRSNIEKADARDHAVLESFPASDTPPTASSAT